MSDDWTPWKDHDGRGCPCVGEVVQVALMDLTGRLFVPSELFIAGAECSAERIDPARSVLSAWVWPLGKPEPGRIIRYRIRKPKGLAILQAIAADPSPIVPVSTPEHEAV